MAPNNNRNDKPRTHPQHASTDADGSSDSSSSSSRRPVSSSAQAQHIILNANKIIMNHATNSSPLYYSHINNSMSSEFNLIREVDADILEQGVEEKRGADLADFDDDGRRMEAICRNESNISLEGLDDDDEQALEHENKDGKGGLSLQSSVSDDWSSLVVGGGVRDDAASGSVDESRNDLSSTSATSASSAVSQLAPPLPLYHHHASDIISTTAAIAAISTIADDNGAMMPVISEDMTCHAPHPADASSNNIIAHQQHQQQSCHKQMFESPPLAESLSEDADDWSFLDTSTSPQSPSKPHASSQQTQEIIYHDALTKRIVSGRAHHRSASYDRRIIESAQFAEAVGEEPDTLLLKKIIEEDSSSDFDDDVIDEEGGGDEEEEEVGDHVVVEDDDDLCVDYQEDDDQQQQQQPGEDGEEQQQQQPAGEVSSEKTEPTCVSTDVAKMSLKEECLNSDNNINQADLSQLSAALDSSGGIVDSAPTTPSPSPCKAKVATTSFHPPYIDWKFTRQHSSGSELNGGNNINRHNKNGSSNGATTTTTPQETDFDYRGIRSKYLEVTKRGMARGNYAQLHRKAWLEVSDKHHRYGKNLRMYYKHWESIGHPYHMFFDWLDSKKEAMGNPLPNLPEIPRSVLDSDTVLYITDPEISSSYALDIVANPADGSALIMDQDGNPISTGKEGWIFVLRDHVLYGSQKVTAPSTTPKATVEGDIMPNGEEGHITTVSSPGATASAAKPRQRFHHSSFFGGKAVASAGIFLTDEQGRMTQLYPHSGHYRPGEAHMQRALFFFQQLGVELSTFVVDMQQIFKVSRKFAPGQKGGPDANTPAVTGGDKENDANATTIIENGGKQSHDGKAKVKKSKKVDCLHLMCGLEVACFLTHKALMIEKGVFHQIHKIRRIRPKELRASVRAILENVNNDNK